MAFSKQHCELIARAIRDERDNIDYADRSSDVVAQVELDSVSRRFAGLLAARVPNFNRERFLRACGVEEGSR